jgi:hypothetical protein
LGAQEDQAIELVDGQAIDERKRVIRRMVVCLGEAGRGDVVEEVHFKRHLNTS